MAIIRVNSTTDQELLMRRYQIAYKALNGGRKPTLITIAEAMIKESEEWLKQNVEALEEEVEQSK